MPNTEIKRANYVKLLGVTIDNKISVCQHAQKIVEQISIATGIIYDVFPRLTRW